MIAKLRRRHRSMVTMLFLLATGAFIWAIVAQKSTPPMVAPPGAATAPP